MTFKPYQNEKEKDILKAITDYLSLLENQKKLYFVRVGSGGIKTEAGHWVKTGRSGCPDVIICVKGGKFIGIEVKTKKGYLSNVQRETGGKIKTLGGLYWVVRSVDEMENLLRQ